LTIGAPEKGKHLKELPAEASSRWKTSNDALSEDAAEGAQGALAIEEQQEASRAWFCCAVLFAPCPLGVYVHDSIGFFERFFIFIFLLLFDNHRVC
jgi:hypothetical protein